jgi:hypothetical protein
MSGTRLVGQPEALFLYGGSAEAVESAQAAFYHAVAQLGTAGVAPEAVAAVATDYLPFPTGLLGEHARQAGAGKFPPDEGTLEVLAAAVDHPRGDQQAAGHRHRRTRGIKALVERGLAAGHDQDGLPSLVGVIAGERPGSPRRRPPGGA